MTPHDNDRRWYTLENRRKEIQIARCFRFFRERGIEPILIKGWAAARFYPDDHPRTYGDTDLAVSRPDFPKAQALLRADPGAPTGVDLHQEFRHLETLSWTETFGKTELIYVDNVPIRVLCPEDHLRLVSTHWLNDGGTPRDRLWDVYYATKNRPGNFDWARCLDVAGPVRRSWVLAAIGLAHRYLGLNIEDLYFAGEVRSLPRWLTQAVEREWASETRLIDLELCLGNPRLLLTQLRKRIPPNPIQATIELGVAINDRPRGAYQVADILKRIPSSLRRVGRQLRGMIGYRL